MTANYAEAVNKHRIDLLYLGGKLVALIEMIPPGRPSSHRERRGISGFSKPGLGPKAIGTCRAGSHVAGAF